jgi:signal transduction histidine kinase
VPPLEFIAEKHRDLVTEKIANVLLNGYDVVEANFITKGNIETPYYFTGLRIEYNNETCVMGVGIDVSEKTNYYQQIRLLINHLESVREEERTNISREIHDELGQQLTGIKLELAWLRNNLDKNLDLLHQKLKDTLSLTENSIKSLRKISSRLRPTLLGNFGLIPAMEWQTEEFINRYQHIDLQFNTNIEEEIFNEQEKINIYRIYQECLTNIIKHADATKVEASLLNKNGFLYFTILDNGKGFDTNQSVKKNSYGIIGIKERVLLLKGKIEIISNHTHGTVINIMLPLSFKE